MVEIGPGAVLGPQVSLQWPDSPDGEETTASPLVLASLMQPSDEDSEGNSTGFVEAVAEAYEADWHFPLRACSPGSRAAASRCPSYPFQRRRHWV